MDRLKGRTRAEKSVDRSLLFPKNLKIGLNLRVSRHCRAYAKKTRIGNLDAGLAYGVLRSIEGGPSHSTHQQWKRPSIINER